jgi:hypothetical protein
MQDKLMRPATEAGLDGVLLAAAKRAAFAKDERALLAIATHLQSLADLATSQKNKALVDHCRHMTDQLKLIATNPGTFLLLERKSLARSNKFVSADDDEIATAAAIAGRPERDPDVNQPDIIRLNLDIPKVSVAPDYGTNPTYTLRRLKRDNSAIAKARKSKCVKTN